MKHKSQVHQFGPYEFNPAQQQLRQGKSVQTLPVSLNKLLLLFVSRPGELITRDQIAEALWEQQQETVDTAAGINTAIRRLRTRIGDNNGHGVFIETVVGSGYRFAAQVSVATPTFVEEASAPTPVPTTALTEPPLLGQSPESEKVRPRKRRQWIALSCGSLLFLAAMALAVGYWAKQNTSANTSRIAETSLLGILQPATFDEPEDELTAQAISPSGKLVAASDRHGILLRTLASGAVRRLDGPLGLRIAHIAWLPNDGGLLVTTALRQTTATASASTPGSLQLWKIDLNGASPQPLLSDASFAAVSPNGEHIAFLRHGQTEIWIAALDGSAPRRLTQSSNADVFTWLLWSQRDTLILTDRRSTGIPQIADQDLGALKSVTPDSAQDDFTYESYDARTGTKTASRNGVRFDSAALLSNRLVYPDNQSHDAAELTSVEINPDTGAFLAAPRNWPIETRATALNQLTASSDGQTLSLMRDGNSMDVFVAGVSRANPLSPPTLSDVTRISNHDIHNFPTAWNPESTAVLFEHGVPSSVGLQSVEASPSQDIALSKSPSDAFSQARYSPDGRWILYRRVSPTDVHRYDLMRVASNGGTPQVVPTSVSVADFRCSTSAAGRCVLRLVEDRRALVYFDLDPLLGVGRELARTPWQPNIFGDWSISPDGTTVAMPNHDPAHPLIQLVPLASSAKAAPRQIPAPGFGTVLEANWASDGRGFFVETFAAPQYNLIWVDLQGNINLLRRSPELIYALNSPDGRKIAFPFNSANHNVWVGQATARALR